MRRWPAPWGIIFTWDTRILVIKTDFTGPGLVSWIPFSYGDPDILATNIEARSNCISCGPRFLVILVCTAGDNVPMRPTPIRPTPIMHTLVTPTPIRLTPIRPTLIRSTPIRHAAD